MTVSKEAMLRLVSDLKFSGGRMAARCCDSVLVLVCGLPAAGKTTLVKHLVATNSTPSRLYERISFDDLYEQTTIEDADKPVEFDPEKWKTCQKEMVVRVSKRLHEQNTTRRSELVLLVDDNFQYRSLRKRFFHLATELDCGFGLLYVNAPAATCRERNTRRSKDGNEGARVPDEVLQRMIVAFEAPNGYENPWEVNTCEVNDMNDTSDIKSLMDTLIQQAHNEVKERRLLQVQRQKDEVQQRRDRLATRKSVHHLVDLQLRQWISMQLQDEDALSPGMTKAQLASQLNQRRKNYLAAMKRSPNGIANLVQSQTIEQVVVSLVLRFQQE